MGEMAGLCPMLLSPWNAPAAVYMYKSWVSASPRDLREEVQCFPGMVREVAKGGGHRFIMESLASGSVAVSEQCSRERDSHVP